MMGARRAIISVEGNSKQRKNEKNEREEYEKSQKKSRMKVGGNFLRNSNYLKKTEKEDCKAKNISIRVQGHVEEEQL
ncbi:hypothetical protein Gotur_009959 [Gossypium turneri]